MMFLDCPQFWCFFRSQSPHAPTQSRTKPPTLSHFPCFVPPFSPFIFPTISARIENHILKPQHSSSPVMAKLPHSHLFSPPISAQSLKHHYGINPGQAGRPTTHLPSNCGSDPKLDPWEEGIETKGRRQDSFLLWSGLCRRWVPWVGGCGCATPARRRSSLPLPCPCQELVDITVW